MTVGNKLTLTLSATLGVICLYAILAITGFRSSRTNTALLVDNYAAKLVLAGRMSSAEGNMLAAQRGMMVEALTGNDVAREQKRSSYVSNYRKLQDSLETITPLLLTSQSRGYVSDASEKGRLWASGFDALADGAASGKGADLWAQKKTELANLAQGIEKDMSDLTSLLESQMQQNKADVSDGASLRIWLSTLLTAVACVVSAIAFIVIRGINRKLRESTRSLAEIASSVSSAASQIASSSQSLAQSSSEQAGSVENTTASTRAIGELTRQNADATYDAAKQVAASIESMNALNGATSELAISIEEVSAAGQKIAGIIRLIDEIAFQTNLLALNAAVEAARAGEAGKGFAVVADEVRNLAQRCAGAARDTSTLIESSVTTTTTCNQKLGSVLSGLHSSTGFANQIKERIETISKASDEQSSSLISLSAAIVQIRSVTQQVAANAEENAAAGEELSAQAINLSDHVQQLGVMVGR